jgi:diguanylate cyclase (GGDEF)-like protein
MENASFTPGETSPLAQRHAAEAETLRRRCEKAESELEAIQQRNQVLGASAPFGILTIEPDGRITGMNFKIREMLPWPPHVSPETLNIFEFDALMEAGVSEDFLHCWKSKQSIIRDYPCIQDSDHCLHLRFHLSPIADDTGVVSGVMAFVENHTQLRQAQDAARETEERYRLLFQSAPVPMIERDVSEMKTYLLSLQESGISDLESHFRRHPEELQRCLEMVKTVDYNDAFLRLLEATDKSAFKTKMPRVIVGQEFSRMAEEGILSVLQGTALPEREMTIQTLQGNRKRIMAQYMLLSEREHALSRVVISLVDITKRVEAEEALRASEQRFREQALRDNLTGLYNRRFLYQSLPDLIQSARNAPSSLSLLFMDMDNFKSVVDAYGHLNGSRAIQEVAGTIRAAIEPPSYGVAYAGDEFVVVLPGHGQDDARQKAVEIQSRIKATAYLSSQGEAVRLQASCGIASFPADADDSEGLLAAADAALFAVKRSGKGTFFNYADIVR